MVNKAFSLEGKNRDEFGYSKKVSYAFDWQPGQRSRREQHNANI